MFAFTLRQIEVFLLISETGSFRRSAELMGVSEANISNHIRALESQLGYDLFIRRRGAKSTLSKQGVKFRDGAKKFCAIGVELSRSIREAELEEVNLDFLIGVHLLEDLVRPALPEFLHHNPHISFNFRMVRTRNEARKAFMEQKPDGALWTVGDVSDMPGAIVLDNVEVALFANRELAERAERDGLQSIPYLLPVAQTEDEADALHHLRSVGVTSPTLGKRYQFYDVAVGMAIEGMGAFCTLHSIVEALDRDKQLQLLRHIAWHQRCLYLSPQVDPEVSRAIGGFFRSITRARIIDGAGGPAIPQALLDEPDNPGKRGNRSEV